MKCLFSEIKEQPAPAFDFNVQELVLSKLPKTHRRLSTEDIIAGFLVIFHLFLHRHSCLYIPKDHIE